MSEWSPHGDPILALLPAERPWSFDTLPLDEQKWRARMFLAVWIQTNSLPFAWFQALRHDPDDAEVRAWVEANLTNDLLIDGLQSRQQPLSTAPTEPTEAPKT